MHLLKVALDVESHWVFYELVKVEDGAELVWM